MGSSNPTKLANRWYMHAPSMVMHLCWDGQMRLCYLPGTCQECRMEMPQDARDQWSFYRRAAWGEESLLLRKRR